MAVLTLVVSAWFRGAGVTTRLTVGGGTYHCLGTHVARLVLAEALTAITRRMPNLRRLAPAPWKGFLPIEFNAGQ